MSATLYKVIHLTGVLMVFVAYGGLIFRSLLKSEDAGLRKFGAITAGVGLFLALLGGFGLVARSPGINYSDGWVIAKIVIFVIFGGLIVLINRKPELGKALWWTIIVLGATAAYLAGAKPF